MAALNCYGSCTKLTAALQRKTSLDVIQLNTRFAHNNQSFDVVLVVLGYLPQRPRGKLLQRRYEL